MTATTPPTVQAHPPECQHGVPASRCPETDHSQTRLMTDPHEVCMSAVIGYLIDNATGFHDWWFSLLPAYRIEIQQGLTESIAAALPVTGCPGTCLPEAGEYRREIAAKLAADVLTQKLTGTISPEAAGRAVVRIAQPIEAYLRGEQA